jgi:hypothetical protein
LLVFSDIDFDAEDVLTTDYLRKFLRKRIQTYAPDPPSSLALSLPLFCCLIDVRFVSWRDRGLQCHVSHSTALLPGSGKAQGVPAPTARVSPDIRTELLSCFVTLPPEALTFNSTQMFHTIKDVMKARATDANSSAPDETEQKLNQMMTRAESVVAAYNERATRVIVNVLVTSDEVVGFGEKKMTSGEWTNLFAMLFIFSPDVSRCVQVHFEPKLTENVRRAIISARETEEESESKALDSGAGSASYASASTSSAAAASADDAAKAASDTTARPRGSSNNNYHVLTFSARITLNPQPGSAPQELQWRLADFNDAVGMFPELDQVK